MRSHTLIIGGTGMLKDASLSLASSTSNLTSVASTTRSLHALDAALKGHSVRHYPLQLDWSKSEGFLEGLSSHIAQVGPPSLVVAWLHNDQFGVEVARLCGSKTTPCNFFQVRGSSAAAPHANAETFAGQFKGITNLEFHQIILGFMQTPSGSRWLRNAEISAGVLRAIQDPKPLSIVGVVEPWEDSP